jgi:hypothetical protein
MTATVRVVVAGQQVPDEHNIEWGQCCSKHELFGVLEAKHWMPVVKEMKRRLPVEPGEVWLAGICHARNGRPDEIMKIIKALPKEQENA